MCGIHFEGACAGKAPCVLDGQSDASVTVAVEPVCSAAPQGELSVAVSGRGRVTLGNVPIDCGAFCTAAPIVGTPVELIARPDPAPAFWDGAATAAAQATAGSECVSIG